MTDPTRPEAPHPDDEALSAALDGDDAAAAEHAEGCDRCGARLAALRLASEAVATPVAPPPAAARDAAIAAALAAAPEPVVRLADRRSRARELWPALAAVAAVVLLAFPLVALLRSSDTGDDTAASGGDSASVSDEAGDSAEALAAAPTVDGGDLGEIDPAELRPTVEPLLGGATAFSDDATQGAAGAASPSTTSAAAQEDAAADTDEAAPTAAPPPAARSCESGVRADDPDLGSLRYIATGTVEGEPVFVLVFDVPGGASQQHRLYVLAQPDCRIVNVQSF